MILISLQNVCRPPITKSTSRASVSSQGGSPVSEAPPVPLATRPSLTSAAPASAPPPIPERQTPGMGSVGRLGSLSGASEFMESITGDKSKSDSRRDSQSK